MAQDLAGNRAAIRRTLITTGDLLLDDEGLTTELTGDPLVDALSSLAERVTALRLGHR